MSNARAGALRRLGNTARESAKDGYLTNTVIDTTSTVLSKDGTTISYLSLGSGSSVIIIAGALSMAADYATFARALAEHFTAS